MEPWLDDFKQTIETSVPRLLKISEEQSEQPRSEEHWSSKQIIGHLIDSAANNHARFVLGQIKDDLVFPGYEQDSWVEIQHYQQAPWTQLVDLWRAYNLHLLHVMSWAAADKMHHRCTQHNLQSIAFKTVSEAEPATLSYLMKDYVVHLKHHLGQILSESA
ncbi:MAG: DinB family protein [Acidobacteriota bacterium]